MEKKTNWTMARVMTRSAWLHVQDSLDIGKFRLFAGNYQRGEGAKRQATAYVDVDALRVVFGDLALRGGLPKNLYPNQSVEFFGGSERDGRLEARIVSISEKENMKNPIIIEVSHGPGRRNKTGGIYPEGKLEKVSVILDRWNARILASKVLAELTAYESATVMSRRRSSQDNERGGGRDGPMDDRMDGRLDGRMDGGMVDRAPESEAPNYANETRFPGAESEPEPREPEPRVSERRDSERASQKPRGEGVRGEPDNWKRPAYEKDEWQRQEWQRNAEASIEEFLREPYENPQETREEPRSKGRPRKTVKRASRSSSKADAGPSGGTSKRRSYKREGAPDASSFAKTARTLKELRNSKQA